MKRLFLIILLMCSIYFIAMFAMNEFLKTGFTASAIFNGINPRVVETEIINHYKNNLDVEELAIFESGAYELTMTHTDINNDGRVDILTILESEATCGSGGCLSHIFIQNRDKSFEPIVFSIAIKNIEPLATFTNNMRDLRINNSKSHHMVWNGYTYILESV